VLTRTATELVTKRATFRFSDGSSHRSCFPVPFPEYVFHVEEAEVHQELLNCSLPVSLLINIFQLPLKIWSWSVSLVLNKPRMYIIQPKWFIRRRYYIMVWWTIYKLNRWQMAAWCCQWTKSCIQNSFFFSIIS
jgi:hypothetical protein